MISPKFNEIKIKELDDEASGPSHQGSLMRLVLRLSETAPYEWSEFFNQAWQQTFYMMKRSAHASGDHIEVICMPDELQSDHIPELKEAVAKANAAYTAYVVKQEHLAAEHEAAKQKQEDDLSELKGNLNFD